MEKGVEDGGIISHGAVGNTTTAAAVSASNRRKGHRRFRYHTATFDDPGLAPGCVVWKLAECAAAFAAEEMTRRGTRIEYRQMVKVSKTCVAGVMYYITFTGIDCTEVERIYQAKVWAKIGRILELKSFEEVKVSEKSAQEMREEVVALLEKRSALVATTSSQPQSALPTFKGHGKSVYLSPKRGEILLDAFRFLLEEIRNEKRRTYAMARRAASKKWRAMEFKDKLPYIHKAWRKFGEANLP